MKTINKILKNENYNPFNYPISKESEIKELKNKEIKKIKELKIKKLRNEIIKLDYQITKYNRFIGGVSLKEINKDIEKFDILHENYLKNYYIKMEKQDGLWDLTGNFY